MAHMGAIFSRFAFICDECESSYVCVCGMHLVFALSMWIFLFWHFSRCAIVPRRARDIRHLISYNGKSILFHRALSFTVCLNMDLEIPCDTQLYRVLFFVTPNNYSSHVRAIFFLLLSTLLTFFTSKFVYRISSYKLETENFFFYALPANEICLRFHPIVLVCIVYCMCLCSRDATGFFLVRQTKQIFPFRRSTSINYRENVENSNRKHNFLITTSISSKLFGQRRIVSICRSHHWPSTALAFSQTETLSIESISWLPVDAVLWLKASVQMDQKRLEINIWSNGRGNTAFNRIKLAQPNK